MGTSNKQIPELTVSEAAELLDVSTRTIINYIQGKELEATKVGKSWYIKTPSFDAFCQRYKFKFSSRKIAPPLPDETIDSSARTSQKENFSEKGQRKKKREVYSITQLRLFELCHDILGKLSTSTLEITTATIQNRITELKEDAVELLGAGCYSYSKKDKQRLYQMSREKVGAIISLYYFDQGPNSPPSIIKSLEEDLLPAYSALIRKMENSGQRENSHERK